MKFLLLLLFSFSFFADATMCLADSLTVDNEGFVHEVSSVDCHHSKSSEEHDSTESNCHGSCHSGHSHIALFNHFQLDEKKNNQQLESNQFDYKSMKLKNFTSKVIRPPIS